MSQQGARIEFGVTCCFRDNAVLEILGLAQAITPARQLYDHAIHRLRGTIPAATSGSMRGVWMTSSFFHRRTDSAVGLRMPNAIGLPTRQNCNMPQEQRKRVASRDRPRNFSVNSPGAFASTLQLHVTATPLATSEHEMAARQSGGWQATRWQSLPRAPARLKG